MMARLESGAGWYDLAGVRNALPACAFRFLPSKYGKRMPMGTLSNATGI
jgi:hypothetical protein